MDQRFTLNKNESFLKMIIQCQQEQQPASILYDDKGITRAQGYVTDVYMDRNPIAFRLDNELEIELHTVVALNGVFADNYTEC